MPFIGGVFAIHLLRLMSCFFRQGDTAVLALGRSLDIPVLAEGIETPGQLELLRDMGCAAVQGYFLGRPKPLTALVEAGQIALLHEGLPA